MKSCQLSATPTTYHLGDSRQRSQLGVGIAAVLAFSVSARINEIGIRMSLGADSSRVQRMVLSEGGLLVTAGLLLGVIGALSLSRLMQGLLYGVPPGDPLSLGGAAVALVALALVAAWLPARHTARVEPLSALRS